MARDSFVGKSFSVIPSPRTGLPHRDFPRDFTISKETGVSYEIENDREIYFLSKVRFRHGLAEGEFREADDGEGKARLRVDGPGPAAGNLQPGRESSPPVGQGAQVDVRGGAGGGPAGGPREREDTPSEGCQLTTLQLAEAIALRVMIGVFDEEANGMWEYHEKAALLVLDELRKHEAWFCRIAVNEKLISADTMMGKADE